MAYRQYETQVLYDDTVVNYLRHGLFKRVVCLHFQNIDAGNEKIIRLVMHISIPKTQYVSYQKSFNVAKAKL